MQKLQNSIHQVNDSDKGLILKILKKIKLNELIMEKLAMLAQDVELIEENNINLHRKQENSV